MIFKHVFRKGIQYRMWMPNMPLTLVAARNAAPDQKKHAFAIFRTIPRMTKHEIREYLTKIYNLPVLKVKTMNYLGKRKRLVLPVKKKGQRRFYYKYKDFKKAVVLFDPTKLTEDVEQVMKVPELEEDESGLMNEDEDDDDGDIDGEGELDDLDPPPGGGGKPRRQLA